MKCLVKSSVYKHCSSSTCRIDVRVVIIKYCAEYIGPVLSLHNHWRTATIDTFFHIPDNNTTIITTFNYQREPNKTLSLYYKQGVSTHLSSVSDDFIDSHVKQENCHDIVFIVAFIGLCLFKIKVFETNSFITIRA